MTEQEFSYETWLESQDEKIKAGIQNHFQGLLNSVKATREERDTLSKELKKLAKEVDENSDAGKQIGELNARLAAAEKKSNFIEQAVKQGVIRPGAAYAIATTENLYTEQGEPDWGKIRESIPELFKVTNTSHNAGSGTNQAALPKNDLNTRIREAANKQIK
jgi:hypothetical protein